MNKTLSILVLTLLITLPLAAHDFAVENEDGKTIYYVNVSAGNKNRVEVSYQGSWYGAEKDSYTDTIVIPTSIQVDGKKYAVVGIGEQAFSKSFNLKSITIPESIEYIRDKAFENLPLPDFYYPH